MVQLAVQNPEMTYKHEQHIYLLDLKESVVSISKVTYILVLFLFTMCVISYVKLRLYSSVS